MATLLRSQPSSQRDPLRTAGGGRFAEPVRSLFVSDVHLGSKHSQAEDFLELLESYEPRFLYIVGDFIDGWKLKRRWRWLPVYDDIFRRLMTLRRAGTRICYAPGNHDGFLRKFLANFGVVEVCDKFVHELGDGRRFLVTHGDQFDRIEQNVQWLSLVGTYTYDLLLSTNWWINTLRGKRHDRYAFCGNVKRRVKLLVQHFSDFEIKLADAAALDDCDGIVCGHIHAPRITRIGGVIYCNTGDWVENCSALVEYDDGSLRLYGGQQQILAQLDANADTPTSLLRASGLPALASHAG